LQAFDVLIVGSGLAGLTAALHLAESHDVAVLTKRRLPDGRVELGARAASQQWLSEDDSDRRPRQRHAGRRRLASARSPEHALSSSSMRRRRSTGWSSWASRSPATEDNKTGFHLTREGGHSFRRIIHAADATGFAVQQTLIKESPATRGSASSRSTSRST
jgi:L-aspartate oxidase